jgi:formate hydrogenlyase subunit 6/NADH:ubiquinone oxidoreductase subunit I
MDADIHVDGSVRVNRFRIDLGRCYSCAACVEICPVNSLKHTKSFEAQAFQPSDLILEFDGRTEVSGVTKERIREKIKMIRSYEVRR